MHRVDYVDCPKISSEQTESITGSEMSNMHASAKGLGIGGYRWG